MKTEELKRELVEAVIGQINTRLPPDQAQRVGRFVEWYFREVDAHDLAERSVADLYGAALSHWHFIHRFTGGAPKLRVYNPNVQEHGWQSSHTVVEIVNDDMPFLVDSITMEVNRQGLTLHLIVHPVMRVLRNAEGTMIALAAEDVEADGRLESIIHVEVDRRSDAPSLDALREGLERILAEVRAAVEDWKPMLGRIDEVVAEIERNPPPQDAGQTEEDCTFLRWIATGNFTLLGYRSYDLVSVSGEDQLRVVAGTGLGILRGGGAGTLSASFAALPAAARAQARVPRLLILTKSNARANVHRPGYLDYLGVKRFAPDGAVIGEHRFIGLFTSNAYNTRPVEIPLLRLKVNNVIRRAGFLPMSHAHKSLVTALEQYPRDELFQIEEDDLFDTAVGILRLGERQRTRLFVRRDAYGRFFYCLVFVPREKYNTALRGRMQQVLTSAFAGVSSEFSVQISESALARIMIIVRTGPGEAPEYDVRELEARLARAAQLWEDQLAQALVEHCGEERGQHLMSRYGAGVPAAYREDVAATGAVYDIDLAESLTEDGLAVSLYAPLEAPTGELRFKILREGMPVALSDSLPMLERMGMRVLEERPYRIERQGAPTLWIHDFGLGYAGAEDLSLDHLRAAFHEAFLGLWRRETEADDFNRLVLAAGLASRQVMVLRAYAKYLRQAAFTFSQVYMEQTLAAYPRVARALVDLFEARFDPVRSTGRDERCARESEAIVAALDKVANLDEDRILRQFLALIQATLRTNFFQRQADGSDKPYLSFKFDPKKVPGLPEPRPMFEIFVYSSRFEGVHLRGGKVARGGVRWSDRMEDFRTEVLGLVKAQMVKNAVIVPVGSKGGFVLKQAVGLDREALMHEGVACYRSYLRGLLDVTDNLSGTQVVPPPDVVRHDADDPYLVVAADKGTATFSDYANAVARDYGFWLDDAFASGGSAGYDHKKMGITARGAWESVKRHFRGMGHDTHAQDFTVVGVGDMSGDVFGNAMLLSRHIRLVAAFDHRHIFIDPNPDAESSYRERERMFGLPRSTWTDYDRKLISTGGGLWPRTAKSIPLSPEARVALGIDAGAATPVELMRAILKAPVDLLYNGGIGTYVKATDESNAEVGDKANDAIRVNGAELRVRVVAEGGNLGLTQRGRIEFALAGGRIHTDAIDNSAGVDCSDHEVNIKILLNAVTADGELTSKQRNQLLGQMTDEVARLVLRDNYYQTQILGIMSAQGAELLDEQARYMRHLEKAGRLNRAIEFLPDEEELAARRTAGKGLVCPEAAVLLAYGKMDLYDAVLASDVPEEALLARALHEYFPAPLPARFAAVIERHPLRREIIATCLVNEMVNRVGPTFAYRLGEDTGAAPPDVLRAYVVTREVYSLPALWGEIEALDAKVSALAQVALQLDVERLATRAAQWLLRRPAQLRDIGAAIAAYSTGVGALGASLDGLRMESERAAIEQAVSRYAGMGVPAPLARRVIGLDALYAALDIAEIAAGAGRGEVEIGGAYFALVGRLDLLWLDEQIQHLPADGHWQVLARDALRDDLFDSAAALTDCVFRDAQRDADGAALLEAWCAQRGMQLKRYARVVAELRQTGVLDMQMVSVGLRELRALARA